MRPTLTTHLCRGGLTAFVGLGIAAATAAAQGGMAAPEEAIVELRNSYIEAYNAKDAAAVTALYAEDALLIDNEGTVVRGRAEIEKYFAEQPMWAHIEVTPGKVNVHGNLAWEAGKSTSHITAEDGSTISVPGHYLVVLELAEGQWRVKALSVAADAKPMKEMTRKEKKEGMPAKPQM